MRTKCRRSRTPGRSDRLRERSQHETPASRLGGDRRLGDGSLLARCTDANTVRVPDGCRAPAGNAAVRALTSAPHGRAPLRPARDRAQVAGDLGATSAPGRSSDDDDGTPRSYVLEMLPYPSRRAPHGASEELQRRRRGRALPPPQRHARPAPDGLRRVRPAGGEQRDQDRSAPARGHRGVDRRLPGADALLGHLDRLVARVRHARAALLPLDPVDLPAAVPPRPGLPQGGGGQLVPEGRHGAGQRAGDRRALRALRHASSSCASWSSGSSASPTTPTACWTTSTRSSGRSTWSRCSATGSAAPRAPRSTFSCPEVGVDYSVFTTRPDTLFGATFFVMAPEHPDVLRLAAGTEHEQAVRDYVNQRADREPARSAATPSARRPASRWAAP